MFLCKLVANPCYARNVWGASIPPPLGLTQAIAFSRESELLILSVSTVDLPPPRSTEVIAFSCAEAITFSHEEVITFSCAEVIAFSCTEAITFSRESES